MEIEKYLKNNTLIVCPNSYKDNVLKLLTEKKKIINLKFMTIDEYKKNYLFDYDIKAVYYLVKKYDMKVDNAITLINNLYYIENKSYQSSKLNYLVDIKKELDNNNLLIYNPFFDNILNEYQILVVGYGKLDKFSLSLLKNAIFYEEPKETKKFQVYHFFNIQDEVEYLFNEFSTLIKQGIDINHIYLMNVNSEYYPYLKRYSSYYHIPIDLKNENSIIGTVLGKKFLTLISDGYSSEEIIKELENDKDNKIYGMLINILNKYIDYDLLDIYEFIKYDLLKMKIPSSRYTNVIKLIDVFDLTSDDDYVYLVGFNNPLIPRIVNDIDYITDNIKDEVVMSKTIDINKLCKLNTINSLNRIKNLKISYKDQTPFQSYYPSILLDDLDYEEIKIENNYNYSDSYNKIKYAYLLDNYVKYNDYHLDLSKLYKRYHNMNYRTYNNQYDSINKTLLLEYLDNKLTLSYSHIDNYYKCGFKYYLTNILKLDIYEESFQAIIGSLFHEVLCHAFDNSFDFDKCYNNFLSNYTFSSKENFFLEKLKKDLLFIIETIKEYRMITGFTKELYEQKIDIKLMDSPYVHFKGFIDKVMYKEKNGETLVSIIDYKTGNVDVNIKNLQFGLSMQLPVYMYLINNSHIFDNMKFTGFYLEHILDNEIKIDRKKSYLEQKKDNLKLTGYSTNDQTRLAAFDSTYEKSEMIKGMKVKLDGTLASTSNSLSDEEIAAIIKLVDTKIKEAMHDILEAKFFVNPKILDKKNMSCTFCKYKDVCYKSEKDFVYLTNEEEGDENA